MAKPPPIFDPELGKRDDDHKLRIKPNRKMAWYNPKGPLRRLRRKRMAIGVVVLLCLYVFVKYLPEGVDRKSTRPIYTHNRPVSNESKGRPPPKMGDVTEVVGGRPKKPVEKKPSTVAAPAMGGTHTAMSEEDQFWYDGPIKFAALRNSLMAASALGGNRWVNQNVLFAASNLKSASTLLPMACDMARQNRNDVHFAIVGRESMSIADILEINGVDESCALSMHDARPDRSFERTTESMELSVFAAMAHLRNYIHPQAVIMDNAELENKYFVHNARIQAKNMDFTLIEIPKRSESLRWLTRLDSASLNAWNRVSINILIHAQPSGSGSILRLLHSLAEADYFESTPPHISIELSHDMDNELMNHLQDFRWPPNAGHAEDSRLTLKSRIPNQPLSAIVGAIRFLEGFYPKDARNSHVLVLSPQVELSPLYYHYLKYMVLEYKYSAATRMVSKEARMRDKLLGVSLSLPSTYLNDTTAFVPPTFTTVRDGDSTGPSFLWQAPNSEAALYFGDKWVELHDFVSHSLSVGPEQRPARRISTTYPSWLEYILSFSLTRGGSLVYPQLSSGASLATVHNELYTPPEEFNVAKTDENGSVTEDEFTADAAKHLSLKHNEGPVAKGSLLDMFHGGKAMLMKDMPVLSFDGKVMAGARPELIAEAEDFSAKFRSEVGLCETPVPEGARLVDLPAAYLFCQSSEEKIPVPVNSKNLATPKANVIDLPAAVKPDATAAALPRENQNGAAKVEEAAELKEKVNVISSVFSIPTAQAAADAKALEVKQLGVDKAGNNVGGEDEAVPGGSRYATTAEVARKEVSQVKSASQATAEEPNGAGIETTRFAEVAGGRGAVSAADEVPAAEAVGIEVGDHVVAAEKDDAEKEVVESHEP